MKNKKILSFMFSAALLTAPSVISNNIVKASDDVKPNKSEINKNTNTKGIVTASALNVRSEASTNSKILSALKNNSTIEIVDTVNDWYKIKIGSSYGYVFKQYVKVSNTNATTNNTNSNSSAVSTSNSKPAVVTASALNVRGEASTNSKVLTVLRNNSSIEIIDTVGDWYKIKVGSSYGYVVKKYAALTASNNNSVQTSTKVVNNTATNKTVANNTTKNETPAKSKIGKVVPFALNVRNDSSLKGKVLAILKNNTSVEIVDTVGDWYKIKFNSGYGYVAKSYIKMD